MAKIKLSNEIEIDLEKLLVSRLLIQANSGGGKSHTIRRILEQSHGKVQQIVIDMEGEFGTLREKYDYILAGKDGDVPASVKSASLLARKLLELGTSAIIDLYELPQHERKRFVRLFCDALVNAPKELWHPVIVVLDEAHVFVPEKGESEAAGAVIDLCTRGRKRGFCAVLATQRISKLHKDAAAECNNKLIGRTGLDIDMKRAGDELGFSSKDQFMSLRKMAPGEFYAYGPAISEEVIKTKIGEVKTEHVKQGISGKSVPVRSSEKIKKALAQLADLPQEAEQEAKTNQELTKVNQQLLNQILSQNREIGLLKKNPVVMSDSKAIEKALSEQRKQYEQKLVLVHGNMSRTKKFYEKWVADLKVIIEREPPNELLSYKNETFNNVVPNNEFRFIPLKPSMLPNDRALPPQYPELVDKPDTEFPRVLGRFPKESGELSKGEHAVLLAIAQNGARGGVTREHLTILTGYKRSSRDTYIQRLKARGFIGTGGDRFTITNEGIEALGGSFEAMPTGESLREHLLRTLPEGEKKILDALFNQYPAHVSRETLSSQTGYLRSSRDTYIQRLKARELIVVGSEGVKANDYLFE